MKPLISIIVPVYNTDGYLQKCLDSLTRQSYLNLEVIVVDDGSTDKSGEVCDEYAKKYKRIKVFHKKNGGLSSARNYGIKKAKGELICLVDGDDYVRKDFVKKMVEAVSREDIDIVVCGYNNEISENKVLTGEKVAIELLTKQNNMEIVAWNKIYRKQLFDDISYPEGKNYEDNLTTYKLLSKAKKVAYLGESLYVYVERPKSIMQSSKKEEKLLSRELAAKEAMEYFVGQKDLCAAAEISMLTAKLAFVDFAVSGEVNKKYLDYGMRWVRDNKSKLLQNKYLSQKLKLYIGMITVWGGRLYIAFRKVRHE